MVLSVAWKAWAEVWAEEARTCQVMSALALGAWVEAEVISVTSADSLATLLANALESQCPRSASSVAWKATLRGIVTSASFARSLGISAGSAQKETATTEDRIMMTHILPMLRRDTKCRKKKIILRRERNSSIINKT